MHFTVRVHSCTDFVCPCLTVYEPEVGTAPGMNVLGLILFAVVLGVIISALGEEGQALQQFFVALNKATMKMIALAIW